VNIDELRYRCLRYFRRYRPSAILIEEAANGPALISVMKRRHQRLVHEVTPKGSKTSRLRRHIDTILGQQIVLPKHAAWRDEFVAEFVEFPHGDFTSMPPPSIWTGSAKTCSSKDRPSPDSAQL
jgi:phage terminase large subunit-like protein